MSTPELQQDTQPQGAAETLSPTGRYLILAAAFLGWLFAGTQLGITPLVSRSAIIELKWPSQADQPLEKSQKNEVSEWFAWNLAGLLFGAAIGGLVFGWVGDRAGRKRAMGLSILFFTIPCGLTYFISSPGEMVGLRFVTGLGVGGMWPNGIALVSEAWSDVSRLTLAGLIGTAANVGIVITGLAGIQYDITPGSWRWVMALAAVPALLGVWVLAALPESPKWLAEKRKQQGKVQASPMAEIFRPPLLKITLLGIALGTIPLLGGWGSGNWLIAWADDVGALKDPALKAWTQVARALGGTISSLLGGWLAGLAGRRRSYFLISLGSLLISIYIFNFSEPMDTRFVAYAFILGLISGFYFGWLPLCLPEFFPTRVRSTGAGVSFNFGRVATGFGLLGAGSLATENSQAGAVTSLVYALGMVIIWFVPEMSGKKLDD